MTTARCQIVDLSVTRFYHCISRCVRGAFLCGAGLEHRKQWLENRLELLAASFAVSVAGFSIMDNHLHVLVRLDEEQVSKWTDEEVVRRWLAIYPPRRVYSGDESKLAKWISTLAGASARVCILRKRLANLGWFMKALKEPLARLANREDECQGTFWEGRYRSIAVLDEEALLATCAYIDLNPVAAGISSTPEKSRHTSIRQRVTHFRKKGKLKNLVSAQLGSVIASKKIGNAEQDHWLIPFEDRRPHTGSRPASDREGLVEKFTLGNYLLLVDYTGRLFRNGKARISEGIKKIFQRLDSSVEFWATRLKEMLASKKLRGRCFAGSILGIREDVKRKLKSRVINLQFQSPKIGIS